MADTAKCIRIEVELEDGTVLSATGDHAEQVWSWWASCEVMNHIHGAHYHGLPLVKSAAPLPTPTGTKE